MGILSEVFTWWNGQTLGTRLFTARNGKLIGEDPDGNKFYATHDGKRRWVIYAGEAEASHVSPDWHGWLHQTLDEPPAEGGLSRHTWEKEHQPNQTGTDLAYRPPGSVLTPSSRPKVAGDYEAWQPE